MYLPDEIEKAKVLITVKAYPKPSSKYQELVCTAGLLNGDKWVRIYPVPFSFFTESRKYPKYSWIEIDLLRNQKDFRPESYRPKLGLDEEFEVKSKLGTKNAWAARKVFVLKHVFTSMSELIDQAYGPEKVSLGTITPKEMIDFEIVETSREWKEGWQDHSLQPSFSDLTEEGIAKDRDQIRKVPYKYYYKFLTEGDNSPRRLKIEDWEIGALYWNCLERSNGDEEAANRLVKEKYWDTFIEKNELYFFLGTTLQFHRRQVANPFIIIGIFYPPKSSQDILF